MDKLVQEYRGTLHDNTTDQYRHGARGEERDLPIRKRTMFRSPARLRGTSKYCNCVAQHANLQMNDSNGLKRTATAARSPNKLCKALTRDMIRHLRQSPQLTHWTCPRCKHGHAAGVPHAR
eukprot:7979179-Pyramimonas_sp.AAC.1